MSKNPICPDCQTEIEAPPADTGATAEQSCPACGVQLSWDAEGNVYFKSVTGLTEDFFHQLTALSAPKITPSKPAPIGRASPPSSEVSLVGRTIGGYEIRDWIGRGGMGEVYRAWQPQLDRPVAFKVIGQAFTREEGLLRRFEREAKTIARFNSSRIVQVYDVGCDQDVHFIAMEYIPGGDLKSRTRQRGRIPPEEAIHYMRQAVEGLLASERQKIIHRDLKPENLMLDANGEVKITDFGLAKPLQSDLTLTQLGDYLGTPIYMSPEQAQGLPLDHRSDMYSLGATFFFLLTGAPPYEGETIYEILRKKSEFEWLDPRQKLEDSSFPEGFCRIIRRMTALKASDRYPSFQNVLEDIDRCRAGQAPRGAPKRPRWAALSAAAAAVLVLMLGGYWAFELRPVLEGLQPASDLQGGGALFTLHGKNFPEDFRRITVYFGDKGVNPAEVQDGASASGRVPPGAAPGPVDVKVSTPWGSSSLAQAFTYRAADGRGEAPPAEIAAAASRVPPATGTTLGESQVKARLDGLKERLKGCRDELLVKQDAEALRRQLPADVSPSSREELDKLIQDVTRLSDVRTSIFTGTTLVEQVPDDDLTAGWKGLRARKTRLESNLSSTQVSLAEVKACLDAEAALRLNELKARGADVAQNQLQRTQLDLADFRKGEKVALASFPEGVKALLEGKRRLKETFPGEDERWEKALPESALAALQAVVKKREEADEQAANLLAAVGKLEVDVKGLTRSTWKQRGGDLEKTLGALEASLESLRGQDSKVALDEHGKRVQAARAQVDGWKTHSTRFETAVEKLQDRRLRDPALDSIGQGSVSDTDVVKLIAARDALEAAFKALRERLDIAAADEKLKQARADLEALGAAPTYVADCQARLVKLRAASQSMAPVLAGAVKVRESAVQQVEAFFIDRFEVSIREYLRFLEEPRPAGEAKPLPPGYLVNLERRDDGWPIEAVSYPQALAYLKRLGKDLPAIEEWWLAAKGNYERGHRTFPSVRSEIANYLVPVERGGAALLFARGDLSVHHLSGNVAEWTKARSGESRAEVAGGSYRDKGDGFFSGETPVQLDLSDTRRGFGFRGVLRPSAFFADLLPR